MRTYEPSSVEAWSGIVYKKRALLFEVKIPVRVGNPYTARHGDAVNLNHACFFTHSQNGGVVSTNGFKYLPRGCLVSNQHLAISRILYRDVFLG